HPAEGGVEPQAARLDAPRLGLGESGLDPPLDREPAVRLLGAAGALADDLGGARLAAVLLADARGTRPVEPGDDLLPERAEEVVVALHDRGREAGVLRRVEVEPLERALRLDHAPVAVGVGEAGGEGVEAAARRGLADPLLPPLREGR